MESSIVILGSCGMSLDTWWIIQDIAPETKTVFVDDTDRPLDSPFMQAGNQQIPIVRNWDFTEVREKYCNGNPDSFTHFVCGMGEPAIKRKMAEKALAKGLKPADPIISPRAFVQPDCIFGRATIVHPGTYVYSRSKFGDYVTLIAMQCGHDCVFEDFSTALVMTIGGYSHVDQGGFLGLGSIVGPRLYIAPWVRVGMQSAVIRSIEEPGIIVLGVPAKKRRSNDIPAEWVKK